MHLPESYFPVSITIKYEDLSFDKYEDVNIIDDLEEIGFSFKYSRKVELAKIFKAMITVDKYAAHLKDYQVRALKDAYVILLDYEEERDITQMFIDEKNLPRVRCSSAEEFIKMLAKFGSPKVDVAAKEIELDSYNVYAYFGRNK